MFQYLFFDYIVERLIESYRSIRLTNLTIRRAVVLIQVAPLRVAKDYGTSFLKH